MWSDQILVPWGCRMPLWNTLSVLLLAVFSLAACINPRSFPDPGVARVSYDDVRRISEPIRLGVVVEFQRNGQAFPRAYNDLRDIVIRTVRGSGVIVPVEDAQVGDMRVVVNNIADVGAAAAQGFGSGLTFGAVGTTVADNYEMSVVINHAGRQVSRSGVRHTMFTAIGNATIPAEYSVTTPQIGFQRIVEAMLLRVLADMQRNGELPGGSMQSRPPRSVARS